jgi:pimeloyl-ACP methyl ester carboxylesterase
MRMQRVRIPAGIALSYALHGPEGAPVVVGVHGYLGNAEALEVLPPSLERRYRVLLYDQRGHGRSDAPTVDTDEGCAALYSLGRLARDLDELLDTLGLGCRPVSLVGHSMGGFVSFTYHQMFPHKVRSIVSLSSTLGFHADTRRRMRAQAEAWKSMDPHAWARTRTAMAKRAVLWNFTTPWVRQRPESLETFTQAIDGASPRAWIYCFQAYASDAYDHWDRASEVRVPVLVVHGRRDPVIPEADAIRMREVFPDCRLRLIEAGRHGLPIEHGPAVMSAVGPFLAEDPG